MDDFEKSLVVRGFLNPQQFIAQRTWEPLAEGVFASTIYQTGDNSPRAALLHYLPGARVGSHFHAGFEHILILQGSQSDANETYDAGTLVIHKPGTSHALYSPEGCIALGIWEKPVEFSDDAEATMA